MQTDNRVLDQFARFFTDAAGAAKSFKTELETMMKSRMERMIADLDFVPREEFDAVKAMAAKARADNEKLAARLAELEAKISGRTKARPATPRSPKGKH